MKRKKNEGGGGNDTAHMQRRFRALENGEARQRNMMRGWLGLG